MPRRQERQSGRALPGTRSTDTPPVTPAASKRTVVSPIAVVCLAGGLAIGGALGFWRGGSHAAAAPASPTGVSHAPVNAVTPSASAALPRTPTTAASATPRIGPWGTLTVEEIPIEPPASAITAADCDMPLPDWYLRDVTAATLPSFLGDLGLEPQARDWVVAHAQCYVEGCAVSPSMEVVAGLSSETRGRLHRVLMREPRNLQVPVAFRCPKGDVEAVIATSQLSPDVERRFRSLTYEFDGRIWLMDIPVVCAAAKTDDERVRLIRLLSSTRGTLVRLNLSAGADVTAVANYWSADGRGKDSTRLLTALAYRATELGEGAPVEQLDIAHLLPPLPRARLDSYPRPDDPRYECTWTSLNFFVDPPTVPIREPNEALRWLEQHAEELHPPEGALSIHTPTDLARAGLGLGLGDALVFCDAQGNPMHLAAQVASDVVFTKNGVGTWSPWALQRLSTLLGTYPRTESIRVFREHAHQAAVGTAAPR